MGLSTHIMGELCCHGNKCTRAHTTRKLLQFTSVTFKQTSLPLLTFLDELYTDIPCCGILEVEGLPQVSVACVCECDDHVHPYGASSSEPQWHWSTYWISNQIHGQMGRGGTIAYKNLPGASLTKHTKHIRDLGKKLYSPGLSYPRISKNRPERVVVFKCSESGNGSGLARKTCITGVTNKTFRFLGLVWKVWAPFMFVLYILKNLTK